MNQYKFGVLVGRFQVLHLGHEQMIQKTIDACDHVCIFIGSSQESGTEKNPLPYEFRRKMLHAVFGDAITVCPLPDRGIGNNSAWGEYVLETAYNLFGCYPDLLVTGKEDRRYHWFDGVHGLEIAELYVPKTIHVSASYLRECLKNDEYEKWAQYVNPKLHELYPELRSYISAASGHDETNSI